MDSSASVQGSAFHYFAKFPPEIRRTIWNFAINDFGSRLINVECPRLLAFWEHDKTRLHRSARLSGTLPATTNFPANREARHEALLRSPDIWRSPDLSWPFIRAVSELKPNLQRTWRFSYERDDFFFMDWCNLRPDLWRSDEKEPFLNLLGSIRNIALNVEAIRHRLLFRRDRKLLLDFVGYLSSVERITLVRDTSDFEYYAETGDIRMDVLLKTQAGLKECFEAVRGPDPAAQPVIV